MGRIALALALFAFAGCATAPTVVPAGGVPRAAGSAGPVTLTVFPSHWDGDSSHVIAHVTPVAIEVHNAGPDAVRVSYFDFALTDEDGLRYAALNPFAHADHPSARSYNFDSHGSRYPYGPSYAAERFTLPLRTGHSGAERRAISRAGSELGSPAWHRYALLPHYRPWLSARVGLRYWDAPFRWPVDYWMWVWAWSAAFHSASQPPADVIDLGLPEGVLEPGGKASGYIYFQRSDTKPHRLQLVWSAAKAKDGHPVGAVRVDLDVRH